MNFGDETSWPEVVVLLGLLGLVVFLIVVAAATYLDMRKIKITADQEESLRQLVGRYEQLAANTLDAQQRAAADVAELRSRVAAIEQILRTVE